MQLIFVALELQLQIVRENHQAANLVRFGCDFIVRSPEVSGGGVRRCNRNIFLRRGSTPRSKHLPLSFGGSIVGVWGGGGGGGGGRGSIHISPVPAT